MQTFIKIHRENFSTEFFTFVFHSLLRPELSILMQNESQIWLWQWDIGLSALSIVANADETLLQKASRYEVVLEPGQVLYVPKHWWHYVECESTAISVNTWIELVSQNKFNLIYVCPITGSSLICLFLIICGVYLELQSLCIKTFLCHLWSSTYNNSQIIWNGRGANDWVHSLSIYCWIKFKLGLWKDLQVLSKNYIWIYPTYWFIWLYHGIPCNFWLHLWSHVS